MIGFKDGTASGLIGEMKSFDSNILNHYTKFAWQNNILPSPVYNCSHLTSITAFKVINYIEARELFNLSEFDRELVEKEMSNKIKDILIDVIDKQNLEREMLLKSVNELRKEFIKETYAKQSNSKKLEEIKQSLEQIQKEIENIKIE